MRFELFFLLAAACAVQSFRITGSKFAHSIKIKDQDNGKVGRVCNRINRDWNPFEETCDLGLCVERANGCPMITGVKLAVGQSINVHCGENWFRYTCFGGEEGNGACGCDNTGRLNDKNQHYFQHSQTFN